MKKGAERREAKRTETEIDVDLGAYGKYDLSHMTNFSVGGAFIRTKTLHPVGTQVKLKFQLPGEKEPIKMDGEVMWVYDQPGNREHNSSGVGVKFLNVNQKDHKKISQYIHKANSDDFTPIA